MTFQLLRNLNLTTFYCVLIIILFLPRHFPPFDTFYLFITLHNKISPYHEIKMFIFSICYCHYQNSRLLHLHVNLLNKYFDFVEYEIVIIFIKW